MTSWSRCGGMACRATVSARAGSPGQARASPPSSAASSACRHDVERPGLLLGRAGLVGQVVGVPQEGVQGAHRPPTIAGQQQERIVEVPRLAPRHRAAKAITLPEHPARPSSRRALRARGRGAARAGARGTVAGREVREPPPRSRAIVIASDARPRSRTLVQLLRAGRASARRTRGPRSGRGSPGRRARTGRCRPPAPAASAAPGARPAANSARVRSTSNRISAANAGVNRSARRSASATAEPVPVLARAGRSGRWPGRGPRPARSSPVAAPCRSRPRAGRSPCVNAPAT